MQRERRSRGPRAKKTAEPGLATARRRTLAAFERLYIVRHLRRYRGDVTKAAHHAGLTAAALRVLMVRHRIDRREYLPAPRPYLVVPRRRAVRDD